MKCQPLKLLEKYILCWHQNNVGMYVCMYVCMYVRK
jgi:hypothetical protein